MSYVITRDRPI